MHVSIAARESFGAAPPPPTDGLFFALYPDADAASRIAQLAQALRGTHDLRGKPLRAERLHVTLHHLGNHAGVPPDMIAAAIEAASETRMAAFDVTFDCASSFTGGRGNHPCILRSTLNLDALRALQSVLGERIVAAGLGRHVQRNFTPHVTLLYDDREVAEQPIEPVSWQVREFVLVHSLLGRGEHRILGRWPLH